MSKMWDAHQPYRQNARYEVMASRLSEKLGSFRKRPEDDYLMAINVMAELELFFWEEFEAERKAKKK